MPRLAANLTMLFTEVPFLERFAAAATAGFKGVEFQSPYGHAPEAVARSLKDAGLEDTGLEPVLFNLPPGDWDAGERGLGALPGREAEFEAGLDRALAYARALGCPRLHVLAGVPSAEADPADCRAVLIRNLKVAARRLAPHGVTALVEPINTGDMPGYFLNYQDQALSILDAAAEPNAALQMDLYHCQIVEGDPAPHLRRNIARIGHFQVAAVPGRHEPDRGELDTARLFALIDALGYEGWIGCEYRPRGKTRDGLAWARPYGIGG